MKNSILEQVNELENSKDPELVPTKEVCETTYDFLCGIFQNADFEIPDPDIMHDGSNGIIARFVHPLNSQKYISLVFFANTTSRKYIFMKNGPYRGTSYKFTVNGAISKLKWLMEK